MTGSVFYRSPRHDYPLGVRGEGVYLYDSNGKQYLDGSGGVPGSVVDSSANGLSVACGSGVLQITELQRPGRKRVTAAEIAGQLDLDKAVLG